MSLEELQSLYAQKKSAIQKRLNDFSMVPPSEYFYELVYCMLTPQSSAAHAARAVQSLKEHDFANRDVDPAPLLHQKDFYIRFHHTKGKHLRAAKAQFSLIASRLTNGTTGNELREWLVRNVKGIGYKEASHFLRNVGHRDLAILDRHILRNLLRVGALRSLPKSMTRKRYRAIENKFHQFGRKAGIPVDELDLLFWSLETGEILK